MFFTYVIKNNKNGKTYTGHTSDIENRLKRHNGLLKNKVSSYTSKNKNDGEWILVYKEVFNERAMAIKREKELKSYQGRLFIKNII